MKYFFHFKSVVRDKLKRHFVCDRKFFIKIIFVISNFFVVIMQQVFANYKLKKFFWNDCSLYWFDQFSFIDKIISKRILFRIKNIIELHSDEFVRLQHIFIHCLQYEDFKRVFFWICILTKLSHKNKILNLNFFQLTQTDRIVFLLLLKTAKSYMMLMNHDLNRFISSFITMFASDQHHSNYLHCIWKINFL